MSLTCSVRALAFRRGQGRANLMLVRARYPCPRACFVVAMCVCPFLRGFCLPAPHFDFPSCILLVGLPLAIPHLRLIRLRRFLIRIMRPKPEQIRPIFEARTMRHRHQELGHRGLVVRASQRAAPGMLWFVREVLNRLDMRMQWVHPRF